MQFLRGLTSLAVINTVVLALLAYHKTGRLYHPLPGALALWPWLLVAAVVWLNYRNRRRP